MKQSHKKTMVFFLMALLTQSLSAQAANGYFPNPYDPGRIQVELYMGGAIDAEARYPFLKSAPTFPGLRS